MKTTHSGKSNPIKGDALPLSALDAEASLSALRSHTGLLSRVRAWLQARQLARSGSRRLRVAETVSLGEKRFVAVVQVDGRHFLLAGGPTNIVLLAQLDAKDAFEDVLKKTLTVPPKQVTKRKRPARSKQPAKQTNRQNQFAQRPASAPLATYSNGTENFGDVLQNTMSAGRQPGNQPRKQPSKSTTEQGYFA
jgi:flagellar biogenesis protein FliO